MLQRDKLRNKGNVNLPIRFVQGAFALKRWEGNDRNMRGAFLKFKEAYEKSCADADQDAEYYEMDLAKVAGIGNSKTAIKLGK